MSRRLAVIRVLLRLGADYVDGMKATWNGSVLAESENTVVVDGTHYFPPDSLNADHFASSTTRST